MTKPGSLDDVINFTEIKLYDGWGKMNSQENSKFVFDYFHSYHIQTRVLYPLEWCLLLSWPLGNHWQCNPILPALPQCACPLQSHPHVCYKARHTAGLSWCVVLASNIVQRLFISIGVTSILRQLLDRYTISLIFLYQFSIFSTLSRWGIWDSEELRNFPRPSIC